MKKVLWAFLFVLWPLNLLGQHVSGPCGTYRNSTGTALDSVYIFVVTSDSLVLRGLKMDSARVLKFRGTTIVDSSKALFGADSLPTNPTNSYWAKGLWRKGFRASDASGNVGQYTIHVKLYIGSQSSANYEENFLFSYMVVTDPPGDVDTSDVSLAAVLQAITHTGATIPTVTTVTGDVQVNSGDSIKAMGTSGNVFAGDREVRVNSIDTLTQILNEVRVVSAETTTTLLGNVNGNVAGNVTGSVGSVLAEVRVNSIDTLAQILNEVRLVSSETLRVAIRVDTAFIPPPEWQEGRDTNLNMGNPDPGNMVTNPSFERTEAGVLTGWRTTTGNTARDVLAAKGGKFGMILRGNATDPGEIRSDTIRLLPGQRVIIGGKVRNDVGGLAKIFLTRAGGATVFTLASTRNNQWHELYGEFQANIADTVYFVSLSSNSNVATDSAMFDEIYVRGVGFQRFANEINLLRDPGFENKILSDAWTVTAGTGTITSQGFIPVGANRLRLGGSSSRVISDTFSIQPGHAVFFGGMCLTSDAASQNTIDLQTLAGASQAAANPTVSLNNKWVNVWQYFRNTSGAQANYRLSLQGGPAVGDTASFDHLFIFPTDTMNAIGGGGTGLDSATTSRIIRRILGAGNVSLNGSDSLTTAQKVVTATLQSLGVGPYTATVYFLDSATNAAVQGWNISYRDSITQTQFTQAMASDANGKVQANVIGSTTYFVRGAKAYYRFAANADTTLNIAAANFTDTVIVVGITPASPPAGGQVSLSANIYDLIGDSVAGATVEFTLNQVAYFSTVDTTNMVLVAATPRVVQTAVSGNWSISLYPTTRLMGADRNKPVRYTCRILLPDGTVMETQPVITVNHSPSTQTFQYHSWGKWTVQ